MAPGRGWIAAGAAAAGLAVVAGAFGAHGLRQVLTAADLAVFETAARYQLVHGLGLVLFGLWRRSMGAATDGRWPGVLLAAGMGVFCGSLYLLVATGVRRWGMVTPLGGLALVAGWLGWAWMAWRERE